MGEEKDDTKAVLERAMEMIRVQGSEIDAQRSALDNALDLQRGQVEELTRLTAEVEQLEKLLHESDEGLSEALIVLASMREGLKKVNAVTTQTVSRLTDVGYSPDFTESVKTLSTAVSDVSDEELLDEHEAYLKSLRQRLSR